MKKFATTAILLISVSAFAEHYPILHQYDEKAELLLEATAIAQTNEELHSIQAGARELAALGVEVMKLYVEKNPICKEQFDAMISEVEQMESMTLADVKARYHDGKGLPVAPKHCYLGRSQVVHPVMNILRLNGVWTETIREKIADEFDEVIEHTAKIQTNLDNPPN